MKLQNIRYINISLSLFFFIACFFFPVFNPDSRSAGLPLPMFLIGWLGFAGGHFSWYANVFYFISLVKYKKVKSSLGYSVIALLLALSFLAHKKIPGGSFTHSIDSYGLGYYLWVFAIFIFFVGQAIISASTKATNKQSQSSSPGSAR